MLKTDLIQLVATPWDRSTLPDCPDDEGRLKMDDQKTHVTPWPYVGATCKRDDNTGLENAQNKAVAKKNDALEAAPSQEALVLMMTRPFNPAAVEHCPDFDERMTLTDGKTRGIPYPTEGWNCNPSWSI